MADDIVTPLAPPTTADRVNGVGQRHTNMNRHTFAKRVHREDEGEPSEEERASEGSAEEQDQREDGRSSKFATSGREENEEEDKEAPGRLIDVVA
ncbi:MAG TPA: hypothetical protein PKJ77_01350 [Thermodesulfobacteriota bacterium]|nr:hypothetical protein [Deltaproteobacteria bacterium]HOC37909.1 hypothetical protein [Thermodesulfobacteriota bacterium]